MTHPDILQALAAAHRDDLLRMAQRPSRRVVRPHDGALRRRLRAWLDHQLHRPMPSGAATRGCVAAGR
ncbi:MAG TPA: hypothetical protein VFT62_01795 [Mycobacteriales bacterium]|nr:hypothetical protein [Mycobacteriales bacterium]